MDVDGAKKDAAYNALIDLSQGQAIDTKDISGSINRAIGALSKRADKVTDLKDKGKAALASGTLQAELSKEIADAKGTPYDQQEKYFAKNVGEKEAIRMTMKMPISVDQAFTMIQKNLSPSKSQTAALRLMYNGKVGEPQYQGKLFDVKFDDIVVGETTDQTDGVYEVETGFVVVEDKVIKNKRNLRSKKK